MATGCDCSQIINPKIIWCLTFNSLSNWCPITRTGEQMSKIRIDENQTTELIFFQAKSLDIRHILTRHVTENQTLCSNFRQCLKSQLFGSQTVIKCLKSSLARISDTYCTTSWVCTSLFKFSCIKFYSKNLQDQFFKGSNLNFFNIAIP